MLWTAPPHRVQSLGIGYRRGGRHSEEIDMQDIRIVGLDIAKSVFQVHGIDDEGEVVVRQQLKRSRVLGFFKKLSRCLVGIEACASSHYWSRELQALGHTVRLMPPAYVKPYVKRQKNDMADAEAICEAVTRANMRFVPTKTPEQQSGLMLHRTRHLFIRQQTAVINVIRAHLAEFGIVAPVGRRGVEELLDIVADPSDKRLLDVARACLVALGAQLRSLKAQILGFDRQIMAWHRSNETSMRLDAIPGVGPMLATALVACVADPKAFRSGRNFSAWIGLVPKQHSSGGKEKVDVIVVYKVDRLTRSLADFAKLVELFDGHGVSFVSVTQQFNTTTSMGRLTLNVLLSFAQFEREVTSERILDKIAASKRKGLWVGGMVPLGYEVKNRKVFVIKDEAERVRTIFRRYLELGSLNLLMQDLRQRKIFTKIRKLSTRRMVGGNPLTRGPLAHLLRNRFYIGEVAFKNDILPGEQPAILDRKKFEAVQRKLDEQRTNHTITRASSESLLMGRIFDDRGNRMTPSYASKKGQRYRYYLSSVLSQGRAGHAGSVRRIPAPEVEALVIDAVRKRLKESIPAIDCDLVSTNVGRVEVHADKIVIKLSRKGDRKSNQK